MIAQDIQRIQEDIVRAVAGNVAEVMEGEWEDRAWVHLFTHIEIDQDGGRSSSITFALAHRPGQPLEDISFRLPREAKRLFNQLAEAMRRPGEDRWSSAQLRIERDGTFTFEFSHAPHWRLAGNLIDKRFDDYLDRWLGTPQGVEFARSSAAQSRGLLGKLATLFRPASSGGTAK